MTMETKFVDIGGGSTATAWGRQPAWWRWQQRGKSAALAAATSLGAEMAAWQERGVGGGDSAAVA